MAQTAMMEYNLADTFLLDELQQDSPEQTPCSRKKSVSKADFQKKTKADIPKQNKADVQKQTKPDTQKQIKADVQKKIKQFFDNKLQIETQITQTEDNVGNLSEKIQNNESQSYNEQYPVITPLLPPINTLQTTVRKKKKRISSQITICLTKCHYGSVVKIANAFGMLEVAEEELWNFYWSDMSIPTEKAKELKPFQRINHFPGMLEICRKDLLARNLNRMQQIYPKEYNFFPKTWCLPINLAQALSYSRSKANKTFIIKPKCGNQGRGIYLTKSLNHLKLTDKLICQVYLSKPYLVDGYKFDMRVYTLITSCDPLRVFVYNEGLARFATSRYADPSVYNTTNVFMHLTNYAVNKHNKLYIRDAEAGSKRKISTLNRILASQGVNLNRLWRSIDHVIVKTILSAWPMLKQRYHACFPSHEMVQACFEILGFDILLDHKLHPFILEVNHAPSLHTDSKLDREVKEGLLTDTFTMLNIRQCDTKRVMEEDKKRMREKIVQNHKYAEFLPREEKGPEKNQWQSQIEWEETHLGNFRRVYPVPGHVYTTPLPRTLQP